MKYFVENKILGGENLLQILEEIKRKLLATRLNSSGFELIIFQEKIQIYFREVAVLQEIPDFMGMLHFWQEHLPSN